MSRFVRGYFGRIEPDYDTGMRKASKIAFKLGQIQPLYVITKDDVKNGVLVEMGDYHQLLNCIYRKDARDKWDIGRRVGDYVRGVKKIVCVWGKKDSVAIVCGKRIAKSVNIKERDETLGEYAEDEYKWWIKEHCRITEEERIKKLERMRILHEEDIMRRFHARCLAKRLEREEEKRKEKNERKLDKAWFQAQVFSQTVNEVYN